MSSVLPAEAGTRTGQVTHSAIAGVGIYIPPATVPSAPQPSGAAVVGVSDRVQPRQGVSTPSLAAEAARRAIRSAAVGDAIDLIVVGTTSPDVLWPATACLVQTELGLGMVASFDLYAAEAGVLTALGVADQYVRSGSRGALVIGAETDRQLVDATGETRPRGRAASAVVLRPTDGPNGILSCVLGGSATSDGASRDAVLLHGLSAAIDHGLREAGVALSAVDLVIGEQTAPEVMRVWARSRHFPLDRLLLDPERYQGVFAAAPFVALHDAVAAGRLRPGMLALLISCGQGPTWAVACLRWGNEAVSA